MVKSAKNQQIKAKKTTKLQQIKLNAKVFYISSASLSCLHVRFSHLMKVASFNNSWCLFVQKHKPTECARDIKIIIRQVISAPPRNIWTGYKS